MKYALPMLLVSAWLVGSASAETITMDTTIDSPHTDSKVRILDGPDSPTTVDVVGSNALIPNSIEVFGHSVLNLRGGITNSFISGYNNSTINIFGGIVATGSDVTMFDNSVANMYGGNIDDDLKAKDSAIVNLYGGTFENAATNGDLSVQGDGVMNVHLREYEIVNVEGFDRLVGVLLDGSPIDIRFWVDSFELRSARIVFHKIPEPDSIVLAMIAMVALFAARKRRTRVGERR